MSTREAVVFTTEAPIPRAHLTGCCGALLLTVIVYAAALGGSALLDVKAPILDGVLPCLVAATFLCFYGRIIFPRGDRFILLTEGAFVVVALGLSLACLSYLGATTDWPLRDREMIWVDRHLHFDWLQIMRGSDHHPLLLAVLDGAYATFTSQLIGTALALVVARRTRELDLFFITFICASLLAELANVLMPTLGPMLSLADHVSFAHVSVLGRTTGQIVLALRNGSLRVIDLNAIDGIISFPSLHAAVALIVPYTLRWNRALFWPTVILDSAMLASAVPSGNHYLSDVLGGLAVALLAIRCGRAIQRICERAIIYAFGSYVFAGKLVRITPSRN